MLDQLLGATVEQPNVRVDALDQLAIQLQHEAEHAVCRRMLRPEINCECTDFGLAHNGQLTC